MGCQQRIAERIIAQQADYVLAVKSNQPALLAIVRKACEAVERYRDTYAGLAQEHGEIEKGHGRIETRRCLVQPMASCGWPTDPLYRWPSMRSVVMMESTRDIAGTTSTQRRYYISSLPADAARLAGIVRSHWRIENRMHWVLDMAFGEDDSRVRVRHAAQNFAILRRIAMNLLRQDSRSKIGLRTQRLRVGADDAYRAQLLGLQPLAK